MFFFSMRVRVVSIRLYLHVLTSSYATMSSARYQIGQNATFTKVAKLEMSWIFFHFYFSDVFIIILCTRALCFRFFSTIFCVFQSLGCLWYCLNYAADYDPCPIEQSQLFNHFVCLGGVFIPVAMRRTRDDVFLNTTFYPNCGLYVWCVRTRDENKRKR